MQYHIQLCQWTIYVGANLLAPRFRLNYVVCQNGRMLFNACVIFAFRFSMSLLFVWFALFSTLKFIICHCDMIFDFRFAFFFLSQNVQHKFVPLCLKLELWKSILLLLVEICSKFRIFFPRFELFTFPVLFSFTFVRFKSLFSERRTELFPSTAIVLSVGCVLNGFVVIVNSITPKSFTILLDNLFRHTYL